MTSMNVQAYIREQFAGKRVVLVGNAPFGENCSRFIDSHDVVIRFNLFGSDWFQAGMSGRKLDIWAVNLDSGRKRNAVARARRDSLIALCRQVRADHPNVVLMTPNADDKHRRLKDAIDFYGAQGLGLLHADENCGVPLSSEPSVGFYTSFRIVGETIPISMIGFTGQVNNKHHDGEEEMRWWRNHPLITFQRSDPDSRPACKSFD